MSELLNAYQLAHMADVASPDSLTAPGALLTIARDVAERGYELSADDVFGVADSLVPTYTHERWQVFTDLAACREDLDDVGGTPSDMTDAAGVALLVIAERLVSALLTD